MAVLKVEMQAQMYAVLGVPFLSYKLQEAEEQEARGMEELAQVLRSQPYFSKKA